MLKIERLKGNQNGFASIVIALILIIVLGLLTIGFAQLARQEQQSALGKQLANQAYYAAESGVNDVYASIYGQYTIGGETAQQAWLDAAEGHGGPLSPLSPDACLNTSQLSAIVRGATSNYNIIDSNSNVSYSCLAVNLTPPNLGGTGLAAYNTKYLSFTSFDPTAPPPPLGNPNPPFKTLTFSWQSAATNPGQYTNYALPNNHLTPGSDWDPASTDGANDAAPVIKLTLTPIQSSATSYTRSTLLSQSFTAFLYPSNTNSCPPTGNCQYNPNTTAQAPIWDGGCSTPTGTAYPCSVTIKLPNNSNAYEASITSYYSNTNWNIDGSFTSASGTQTSSNFIGQSIIDVTAKAKNVLKRLRVVAEPCNAGSGGTCSVSSQALVGTICKREQTYPGSTNFIDPVNNVPTSSGPCVPQ